ncbi:MAG: glycerate kinase [Chthoniobacterales bacterium]|nr:glycerate kinase [Chthoniobacterales bacterium]
MRILIAPDKFKGVLTAPAVAELIVAGLQEALPEAQIRTLPIADGGEGTADAICAGAGGEWQQSEVRDSLGQRVSASYCTIDDGETAVLEVSQACGLWRVPEQQRDPDSASSFGVGEMLLAAQAARAKRIIVGLGGSATNDGGFGMARALGFRFFDADRQELRGRTSELLRLESIVSPDGLELPGIVGAADVQTPLLGERGATRLFAEQKGATAEQLEVLERSLAHLAEVAGGEAQHIPGAGAAGGLGFGLMTFCGAPIRSGFDVVAEEIGLAAAVQEADVVITGEGRLDAQTLEGKAPAGVARLARAEGKRVFAIVGAMEDVPAVRALFDSISVISDPAEARRDTFSQTPELLRAAARRFAEKLKHPLGSDNE